MAFRNVNPEVRWLFSYCQNGFSSWVLHVTVQSMWEVQHVAYSSLYVDDPSWFKPRAYSLLDVWPWASSLTSLDSFPLLLLFSCSCSTVQCPTLCEPMDCSMPGLPVHHQVWELAQTHVLRVSDAIQPSHPLLFPAPPASVFPSNRVFSNESSLHIISSVENRNNHSIYLITLVQE